MGYAEDAAAVLASVGDQLPMEQVMGASQALESSITGTAQAGQKYLSMFGSQLRSVQEELTAQARHMQVIREELANEASRLLGGE